MALPDMPHKAEPLPRSFGFPRTSSNVPEVPTTDAGPNIRVVGWKRLSRRSIGHSCSCNCVCRARLQPEGRVGWDSGRGVFRPRWDIQVCEFTFVQKSVADKSDVSAGRTGTAVPDAVGVKCTFLTWIAVDSLETHTGTVCPLNSSPSLSAANTGKRSGAHPFNRRSCDKPNLSDACSSGIITRSPSSALLPTFLGEDSPTNVDKPGKKTGTLILTSNLEDLRYRALLGLQLRVASAQAVLQLERSETVAGIEPQLRCCLTPPPGGGARYRGYLQLEMIL